MPLYEVAILEESKEEGGLEKLVVGPVTVVARDPYSAAVITTEENAEEVSKVDRQRMEVLVRPFR